MGLVWWFIEIKVKEQVNKKQKKKTKKITTIDNFNWVLQSSRNFY